MGPITLIGALFVVNDRPGEKPVDPRSFTRRKSTHRAKQAGRDFAALSQRKSACHAGQRDRR